MGFLINLLIVILAAVVGLAFHIRNDALVTVDYYAGSVQWPLSWALGAALGVGFVLGCLACFGSIFRLKRIVRTLGKRVDAAHREIASLKAARAVSPQTADVS